MVGFPQILPFGADAVPLFLADEGEGYNNREDAVHAFSEQHYP